MRFTHLPGNDPERVDVACLRTFNPIKPETLGVNQFRGCTVEEPINVYPWHCGWDRSHSKTRDMGVSISVDEDVSLDECESMAKSW